MGISRKSDVQDRRPISKFDLEAVAAEGQYFFTQNEGFGPLREELREYADGLRGWGQGCHDAVAF